MRAAFAALSLLLVSAPAFADEFGRWERPRGEFVERRRDGYAREERRERWGRELARERALERDRFLASRERFEDGRRFRAHCDRF